MVRRGRIAVMALAMFVAAPDGAHASQIVEKKNECTGGDECRYFQNLPSDYTLVAAHGERNRVTVTIVGERRDIIFRDEGAPISDVANCTRIDANAARCAGGFATVRAGDLDDVIETSNSGVYAFGDAGDDELSARDTPVGDYGYLIGGPGNDILRGGPSGDYLADGEPGAADDADVFDGGGGYDLVGYGASRAAVKVDLATPVAGESGEIDRLAGIEGASGGRGPDELRAASGPAALNGGGGNDRLVGGPLADRIDPGTGRDLVYAGGGPDRIDREYGKGQVRIGCGDGNDYVLRPRSVDLLRADCEKAELLNDILVRPVAPLRSPAGQVVRVLPLVMCAAARERVRVDLRIPRVHRRRGMPRAGTLLARRLSTRRLCEESPAMGVALSRAGRRLLRRHRRLPVEVRTVHVGHERRFVLEVVAPG